jgi:hypothetical protein
MPRIAEVLIVLLVAACTIGRLIYQSRTAGFRRKR